MAIDMTPERRITDYYAILNLAPDSSDEIIHEQYRRLVKVLHPDRNAGDEWCQEQLKLVNGAYSVLSDASAKRSYDQRRSSRLEDCVGFVEELAEHIQSDAAATEERRKMLWLFDTAAHPLSRADSGAPQIEFVTQRSKIVYTGDGALMQPPASSPAQASIPALRGFYKDQPLFARLRLAVIVCAVLLAALGCAYIASPRLRLAVRPILHPTARDVDTVQLRRRAGGA